MSLVRKLKPDCSITGAIFPLLILPIFGISSLIFGIHTGLIVLAAMMWVFALFYLYIFFRTWNWPQLAVSADGAYFGSMLLVFEPYFGLNRMGTPEFKTAYFTGLVFFGVLLVFLAVNRRLKWRGRELFELAAEPIEEVGNGYTSRPRPVGKVEYTPEQMRAFARFCARHLIALPYSTSKNITLVPIKMGEEFGRLLGLSGDYRDATWVNFDVEGEVSVHISHKDYLDYRQPLAFDQLCNALGELFIEFLELHTKGEGVRAIDRMDDLRIGIFS